jgi:hypothetical protein
MGAMHGLARLDEGGDALLFQLKFWLLIGRFSLSDGMPLIFH